MNEYLLLDEKMRNFTAEMEYAYEKNDTLDANSLRGGSCYGCRRACRIL